MSKKSVTTSTLQAGLAALAGGESDLDVVIDRQDRNGRSLLSSVLARRAGGLPKHLFAVPARMVESKANKRVAVILVLVGVFVDKATGDHTVSAIGYGHAIPSQLGKAGGDMSVLSLDPEAVGVVVHTDEKHPDLDTFVLFGNGFSPVPKAVLANAEMISDIRRVALVDPEKTRRSNKAAASSEADKTHQRALAVTVVANILWAGVHVEARLATWLVPVLGKAAADISSVDALVAWISNGGAQTFMTHATDDAISPLPGPVRYIIQQARAACAKAL